MKKLLFIILFFISVGVFSQEETVETPKIAIKIPLGETITIENHTIKFVEVLEDSRCPENTTCIWEGRARVLVEVLENGKVSFEKAIIFGKVNQGESADKELVSNSNSKVIGLTLNPYPNSEEAIKGGTYALLVYIEK